MKRSVMKLLAPAFAGMLLIACAQETDDVRAGQTDSDDSEAGSDPLRSGEPDREVATAARELRAALGTAPILRAVDVAPSNSTQIAANADALVTGVMQSVEVGATRSFGNAPLACETDEGRTAGESCLGERLAATVVVDVRVDHRLGSSDEKLAPGTVVPVEITIGIVAEGQSSIEVDIIAEKIANSAPVGHEVAMYLVASSDGFWQLAHPAGWALVDAKGTLASLDHQSADGEPAEGLAGVSSLSSLPLPG